MSDYLNSTLGSELTENSDNTNFRLSALPIVRRYRDAYRVAAALVALGNTIKIIGVLLAGVIAIIALSFLSSLGGSGSFGGEKFLLLFGGVFLAAIVGISFWLCGVIVAAQGQILRATLDNTVANSPFLNDQERLDSMGVPQSIAARSQ